MNQKIKQLKGQTKFTAYEMSDQFKFSDFQCNISNKNVKTSTINLDNCLSFKGEPELKIIVFP